jgi:hypothetical protein
MRLIILDELRTEEISMVDAYLKKSLHPSGINGLYWLYLPTSILSYTQKELEPTAGPYKISVEILKDIVRFELLVRAEEITNMGGGHANEEQIQFVYAFVSKMAKELNLVTCL